MLGVVLSPHRLRDLEQTRAAQLEPAPFEASDDLAREPAAHAIGLDEDEGGLAGHAAAESSLSRKIENRLTPVLTRAKS